MPHYIVALFVRENYLLITLLTILLLVYLAIVPIIFKESM